MFLGCSVRDWDLGFVGLAAMTITNFQNFWKVFQRSRKAELWCYNYSAEWEFLGDGRGSRGESQAGGDPGAGPWKAWEAWKGIISWAEKGCWGMKFPFWCLTGCQVGKGGHSSVWSQRVELSEWVDFVTRQIPIQNRGGFLTRQATQLNTESCFLFFSLLSWKLNAIYDDHSGSFGKEGGAWFPNLMERLPCFLSYSVWKPGEDFDHHNYLWTRSSWVPDCLWGMKI